MKATVMYGFYSVVRRKREPRLRPRRVDKIGHGDVTSSFESEVVHRHYNHAPYVESHKNTTAHDTNGNSKTDHNLRSLACQPIAVSLLQLRWSHGFEALRHCVHYLDLMCRPPYLKSESV